MPKKKRLMDQALLGGSRLPLERITYTLKATQHISENTWRPFINYIKGLDVMLYVL